MSVVTQDVLEQINHKDLKAWQKLYDDYYPVLCSYVNSILKNPDNAQDIVQETLIKMWHSERVFQDVRGLTWYLYRAAYNNALYFLRTERSNQQKLRQLEGDECEMSDEQFALTVREELIRQVHTYIEELPEEQKKIILLSLKGHSGKEIAEILGITINTVKTQKNRSFRYLREKLKDSVLLFLI